MWGGGEGGGRLLTGAPSSQDNLYEARAFYFDNPNDSSIDPRASVHSEVLGDSLERLKRNREWHIYTTVWCDAHGQKPVRASNIPYPQSSKQRGISGDLIYL